MKKPIFGVLAIALSIIACDEKKPYTENSSEIDIYKKVVLAYENRNWQDFMGHYSENAQILNNSGEQNAQNILQLVQMNRDDARVFRDWQYVDKEFLMLTKNSGEKWVYFKGRWKATSYFGDKAYEIPAQINVQFSNGKIVREEIYWNIAGFLEDILVSSDVSKKKKVNNASI